MEEAKIYYEIKYHKESGLWVLWKTVEKENMMSLTSIFKGSRQTCRKKLKEIKGEKGDISNGKRIKSVKS